MLIVFGGLAGTGKSTIAELVALQAAAMFLRIDVIEQSMREALDLPEDIGDSGYQVAYALAKANLKLGLTVVADSVNPIALTRKSWRDVAARIGSPILEIEVVCSDTDEHRRRVADRAVDVPRLRLPSWEEVLARHYEPWTSVDLVIDSARLSPGDAAAAIISKLPALVGSRVARDR